MNPVAAIAGLGPDQILERGREVMRIESEALALLGEVLEDNFIEACQLIFGASRQLVITGMGKSGHIGRKVAATFAATGTPAIFVHPGEAAHGDLGMLTQGDVLLVLSNSGNTSELRAILHYARKGNIPIIGVASRGNSLVGDMADVVLLLPKVREACAVNVAPTTSTTLQLALGDALAVALLEARGFSSEDFARSHPAGSLGRRLLLHIGDIMHSGEEVPRWAKAELGKALVAPIEAGQQLGEVQVKLAETPVATAPLTALAAVPEGSLPSRLVDQLMMMFE